MDLNISGLTYFLILKRRALALFSLTERSLTWWCQVRFLSNFTFRYLTLSVGYSLLPHNFIFKSPSGFFCLDLKITVSVFFTLSQILFAFNQLTTCFESAWLVCSVFWLSYYDIIDQCHQQRDELYKILLLDLGHLYTLWHLHDRWLAM